MILFYSILLVVFFYFTVAFHGSLINAYWNCFKGKPTDFLEFYRYALDNGFRFFWIFVAKLAIEILLLVPLALAYVFVLKTLVLPYLDLLLGLVVGAIMLVANFLFFGAFIAAALYSMPASIAIKTHWGFLRRRHVFALLFYGLYVFVFVTNLIPLIQLLALFFTYPLISTALLLFFDAYTGRQQSSASPAPPTKKEKPEKPTKGNKNRNVQQSSSDEE